MSKIIAENLDKLKYIILDRRTDIFIHNLGYSE